MRQSIMPNSHLTAYIAHPANIARYWPARSTLYEDIRLDLVFSPHERSPHYVLTFKTKQKKQSQ